jgi:wyosine [tRNA(Phe)-imidazoG37] synthetase (radical SAM superfamily)
LIEDAPVTLVLSLDGDPFGSKHYRKILQSLDPIRHAKVKIQILTNGLLLTRLEWSKLSNIHAMIQSVAVSIDAAEQETYEDLRRPGKWSVITENMEFLGKLRQSCQIPFLSAIYVIQQKN